MGIVHFIKYPSCSIPQILCEFFLLFSLLMFISFKKKAELICAFSQLSVRH